jgi:hypothetical protein
MERVCSPAAVGTLVRQRLEEIWDSHRPSEQARRAQVFRYLSPVLHGIARQLPESRHRRRP